MLGNVGQDGGQRADAERIVSGNGDVMLATLLRGQTDVAASLPRNLIAQHSERAGKLDAVEVTWKARAHAAITSSRT